MQTDKIQDQTVLSTSCCIVNDLISPVLKNKVHVRANVHHTRYFTVAYADFIRIF